MDRPPANFTSHITQDVVAVWNDTCRFADSPAATHAACTPQGRFLKHSVDDILQIILRTRKSWKTLKGQAEAVWPPYLEATMLKALQEYEPDDSRETRILGRYPMRNRFISDYIHRTTGKYRSAKQVGSRLQQLRDTPEGRELIDVLTRCYRTRIGTGTSNARIPVCQPIPGDPSSSPSFSAISWDGHSCDSPTTSSSSDSPATPSSPIVDMSRWPSSKHRQPAESRMPVYIDILPEPTHWSATPYPSRPSPTSATSSPVSGSSGYGSGSRPSEAARHIRNIDPTVTFVSPSPVNGKSSYIVLLDGAPVHSEDTKLEYVGPYLPSSTGQSSRDGPILYNTALAPKYWDVICAAADPTVYTIVQDVYRIPDPVPNQDYSQRPRLALIFSAVYHFQYPSGVSGSMPSYDQTPMSVVRPGPSMTSTLDIPAAQHVMRSMPFQKPSMYPTAIPERPRTTSEIDQNLFEEPFTLDVNFDTLPFDDFAVNFESPPEGASSAGFYQKDSNPYYM